MKIEFRQVSFEYRSPLLPTHRALENISFTVESGGITAVAGPSGSGKTTLLQHLNGLLHPTSGRILVDGRDMQADPGLLRILRKKVGVAFQFPEIQLFEETVFTDVAFGPRNLGVPDSDLDRRVQSALQLVGLDYDTYKNRSPFHLSGGEKRRTALAGILAMQPEVLVLDEPTVGLDRFSSDCVVEVIRAFRQSGKSVIFVSHDMDLVGALADRVLVLESGRMTFGGSCRDLFSNDAILNRAALVRPRVMSWMLSLVQKGWPVRTDVFTIPEAKAEMERVMHSVKKGSNEKYK